MNKTTLANFNALPRAQKRVALAKDVLKWLTNKKLTPKCGTYIELIEEGANNEDVSTHLKKGRGCVVCAKGALLIAEITKRDKFTYGDLLDALSYDKLVSRRLRDIFPQSQLDLIEAAFEGIYFADTRQINWKKREAAETFSHNCSTTRDSLEKIMKNIIKNKGTFIP